MKFNSERDNPPAGRVAQWRLLACTLPCCCWCLTSLIGPAVHPAMISARPADPATIPVSAWRLLAAQPLLRGQDSLVLAAEFVWKPTEPRRTPGAGRAGRSTWQTRQVRRRPGRHTRPQSRQARRCFVRQSARRARGRGGTSANSCRYTALGRRQPGRRKFTTGGVLHAGHRRDRERQTTPFPPSSATDWSAVPQAHRSMRVSNDSSPSRYSFRSGGLRCAVREGARRSGW